MIPRGIHPPRKRKLGRMSPVMSPAGMTTPALLPTISPGVSPNTGTSTGNEGGVVGLKHDINPFFGAAFFFLAGALRLHPATATAGLIIGVGAAVINYGAGTAAAQQPVDFGDEQPGWLTGHGIPHS